MKSKTETTTKAPGRKAAAPAHVLSALQVAPARVPSPPAAAPSSNAPLQSKPIKIASPSGKRKTQPLTTVHARIDVGFGNSLYIRGQGDGLSWDKGTPLECVDATKWVWSTKSAEGTIEFKLLLNDQVWAQGEKMSVAAGESMEATPVFS